MAALAARKFSLFSKATSRILDSTLQDSSCSLVIIQPATPPRGGTTRPGRKRAPTPEDLRRRHLISRKPGRSSSSHTLGPTEPRLDLSNQKRGVTSPARHRTLRGAGTGQTAPVHHRTEINVVLSFQNLYLSPFRAPIWTPDLCFVAGPTFWVFWVVIIPR
jgi:hypothetical protein